MKRNVPLAVLVILSLAMVASCSPTDTGGPPQDAPRDSPIELEGVEIREYEGADLSAIEDFRENSIAGPQQVDRETYLLSIGGLVGQPTEYAYSEITSGLPAYEKVVTLDCVEGWSVTILWRGVLVRDILEQVDVQPAANTVILRAVDGYSTSFPLDYFYDNDILLAYSMNGVVLPAERGFPFQLVAEDKWGYKWIKWVEAIELSDDEDYQGYWESRGYSDTGDRDKSFYDGN